MYYGVARLVPIIHISPRCIRLLKSKTRCYNLPVFDTEAQGFARGFVKRCPTCFNQFRFNIKMDSEQQEFLLSKQDIEVLLTIKKLIDDKQLAYNDTLTGILGNAKTTVASVKAMMHAGILGFKGSVFPGYKERFRSITHWGYAVIKAYELGIFSTPLGALDSEANSKQLYNKLT